MLKNAKLRKIIFLQKYAEKREITQNIYIYIKHAQNPIGTRQNEMRSRLAQNAQESAQ
jgi:hypothetical protein